MLLQVCRIRNPTVKWTWKLLPFSSHESMNERFCLFNGAEHKCRPKYDLYILVIVNYAMIKRCHEETVVKVIWDTPQKQDVAYRNRWFQRDCESLLLSQLGSAWFSYTTTVGGFHASSSNFLPDTFCRWVNLVREVLCEARGWYIYRCSLVKKWNPTSARSCPRGIGNADIAFPRPFGWCVLSWKNRLLTAFIHSLFIAKNS